MAAKFFPFGFPPGGAGAGAGGVGAGAGAGAGTGAGLEARAMAAKFFPLGRPAGIAFTCCGAGAGTGAGGGAGAGAGGVASACCPPETKSKRHNQVSFRRPDQQTLRMERGTTSDKIHSLVVRVLTGQPLLHQGNALASFSTWRSTHLDGDCDSMNEKVNKLGLQPNRSNLIRFFSIVTSRVSIVQ